MEREPGVEEEEDKEKEVEESLPAIDCTTDCLIATLGSLFDESAAIESDTVVKLYIKQKLCTRSRLLLICIDVSKKVDMSIKRGSFFLFIPLGEVVIPGLGAGGNTGLLGVVEARW